MSIYPSIYSFIYLYTCIINICHNNSPITCIVSTNQLVRPPTWLLDSESEPFSLFAPVSQLWAEETPRTGQRRRKRPRWEFPEISRFILWLLGNLGEIRAYNVWTRFYRSMAGFMLKMHAWNMLKPCFFLGGIVFCSDKFWGFLAGVPFTQQIITIWRRTWGDHGKIPNWKKHCGFWSWDLHWNMRHTSVKYLLQNGLFSPVSPDKSSSYPTLSVESGPGWWDVHKNRFDAFTKGGSGGSKTEGNDELEVFVAPSGPNWCPISFLGIWHHSSNMLQQLSLQRKVSTVKKAKVQVDSSHRQTYLVFHPSEGCQGSVSSTLWISNMVSWKILENPQFRNEFTIMAQIALGFSTAMFDCQSVQMWCRCWSGALNWSTTTGEKGSILPEKQKYGV